MLILPVESELMSKICFDVGQLLFNHAVTSRALLCSNVKYVVSKIFFWVPKLLKGIL